jgi:hypothetical protein
MGGWVWVWVCTPRSEVTVTARAPEGPEGAGGRRLLVFRPWIKSGTCVVDKHSGPMAGRIPTDGPIRRDEGPIRRPAEDE